MLTTSTKHSFSDILKVNTSYFLILSRFVLILFASFLVLTQLHDSKIFISLLILSIIIIDYFDGVTFRTTSYSSDTNNRVAFRTLDSIADRLIIQIGSISLLIVDAKFLPFYFLILLREMIISGYCSYKFFQKVLIYPNNIAKIATGLIAISIIVYLLFDPYYAFFSFIIMSFSSYSSFSDYKNRYKQFKLSGTKRTTDSPFIEIW